MKKSILSIVCFVMTFSVYSQKLINLYKKGTIRLIPDTEYARGNDWNQVFRSYRDSMMGKDIGARKSLILMPDGSVVVNHAYQNYYTMFSPEGKFVKEFGIRNAKDQQLKKIQAIEGVINNTFFTEPDNMGYMNCFDFNGKLVKKMRLNYLARQMVVLPNQKIAVVGWVIWKDCFRTFVSIVDYNTNKEHVIWEHRTKQTNKVTYIQISDPNKQKDNKSISKPLVTISNPPEIAPPIIAYIGNKLLINLSESGDILEYDLSGKFLTKKRANWAARFLSVEERKKDSQAQIDGIKYGKNQGLYGDSTDERSRLVHAAIIRLMKENMDRISKPKQIPYFSTVIKDSDGNLLFFEYPKEENNNIFHVWVFENGGRFVCKSSFVCNDYDLNINPSRMVFHNGYLYSLQNLKNASGIPMRLVRFRLSAD